MLYEIHQPLAEQIAEKLDMTGISSLMDIGGGSGIISFALTRKHHELKATVFDIENVCAAGRKLAEENDLIHRVNYISGNFVEDNLPTGFDMIIESDVGIYNAELFAKVMGALNPNGRFVIITNTNEGGARLQEQNKQPSLMSHLYSFLSSLSTDKSKDLSSEDLRAMLQEVGFQKITMEHVENGVILIEGEKILN
jgi:ubiquinone/menaquinone biosynthesis C-methylase UbiE